jgi:hypothetical protein
MLENTDDAIDFAIQVIAVNWNNDQLINNPVVIL